MTQIFILIYILGFIFSYKFMFNYFKRDNLTERSFKIHILFLSSTWFLFWILWFTISYIAPTLVFTIWFLFSLIFFPKKTFREIKEYLKK